MDVPIGASGWLHPASFECRGGAACEGAIGDQSSEPLYEALPCGATLSPQRSLPNRSPDGCASRPKFFFVAEGADLSLEEGFAQRRQQQRLESAGGLAAALSRLRAG